MATDPTPPRPTSHHGRLCWETRWRGAKDPKTGKRPRYAKRWFVPTEREAKALFKAWLRRWQQNDNVQDPRQSFGVLTITELAAEYLAYAEGVYRKRGKCTSYVHNIRSALQALVDIYGGQPAAELTPVKLAKVRDSMIRGTGNRCLARQTVNKRLDCIRHGYKWAVEKGLVPALVWQGLLAVSRLRKGRSAAHEGRRIAPIHWTVVKQTLGHLSAVVASMVQVQWHTGMRPDEVCMVRFCDIEQGNDVWLYRPQDPKLDHLEKSMERIIAIGPQAQAIIRPYLNCELQAFLFRPTEGSGRNLRSYGDHYTSGSYRRAVHRACDRAFRAPEPLCQADSESVREWRQRLSKAERAELLDWQKAHRWSPNQLRHAKATDLRKKYGLERTREVLGSITETCV